MNRYSKHPRHFRLRTFRNSYRSYFDQKVVTKNAVEVAFIRRACQITCQIYEKIIKHDCKPGVKEIELAQKISQYAMELGADGEMAFPTIVGSGPNSSFIHSIPSNRKIKKGDVVQFDFGVKVNGYCSDMSRVVFMGKKKHLPKKIFRYYELVRKTQEKAVGRLKEGRALRDIAAEVTKKFQKKGLDYNYLHSLGHGVGVDIHEFPRISEDLSPSVIPKKGMVITIEPGLYFPGKYGFRVEDTIHVTDYDYNVLTTASKKFCIG
jgi:Xaa-Pro aminopeptidase